MNEEEERKLTIKHQKDTKLEVDNLKEKKIVLIIIILIIMRRRRREKISINDILFLDDV